VRILRRNELILLVIIVITLIVGAFPTPHKRIREDLVETLDCSTTLVDGGSLVDAWSGLQDQTKIVVDIHSSEDVNVRLSAVISTDIYEAILLYNQVRRVHSVTFMRSDPAYEMTVYNQRTGWWGSSANAEMSGSIKGYHVYEEVEWLPWWLP
jgi:hypothetical protein